MEPTYTDPILQHYYEASGRREWFLRENPPPLGFVCAHDAWVMGYEGKTRRCRQCGELERLNSAVIEVEEIPGDMDWWSDDPLEVLAGGVLDTMDGWDFEGWTVEQQQQFANEVAAEAIRRFRWRRDVFPSVT